jgi:hypothetical protein
MVKKIAIHQPNYLPWLGFFMKTALSDVLVLHDNVQYTKGGPTRRCMLRKDTDSSETDWMTVPLIKHSDFSLLKDLKIETTQKWQRKHNNRLFYLYRNTPFFVEIFPLIEKWVTIDTNLLCELNSIIIKDICKILNFKMPIYSSSSMPVALMDADNYNLSIVQYLEGTHYIAGSGSANYQNDNLFVFNQIKLMKCDFKSYISTHPYPQTNQPFLAGLTIIDVLMNLGVEGTQNYIADFKQSVL